MGLPLSRRIRPRAYALAALIFGENRYPWPDAMAWMWFYLNRQDDRKAQPAGPCSVALTNDRAVSICYA